MTRASGAVNDVALTETAESEPASRTIHFRGRKDSPMRPKAHTRMAAGGPTIVGILLAVLAGQRVAGAEAAIAINSGEPQLFVDDFLIDAQENLKRTLRQPTKDDGGNVPVIALDKEFGD